MSGKTETMRAKLEAAFAPSLLDLVDESEKHRGHAGYQGGGESHFRLTIISTKFEGQSRLQRQREINEVLREELSGPIHALSVTAKTPDEVA